MDAPAKRKLPSRMAIGALFAALVACFGCPRKAERVVLISVDTLRADHVGAYGAEGPRTPALDAIASRGVRFETAISPAPLTLPSHTSLMTGLDPSRHGVRHNAVFRLEGDVPTLAERMRDAGFETAAFVSAFILDRKFGLDRGFDSYDDQMGLASSTARRVQVAERRGDEVVDAALAWLETAPSRFFLWVHLYDPHSAYQAPARFASAFPEDPYSAEIAFADSEVGRLLEAVGARWSDRRTLVVATSDHGESRGEHGEDTHAYGIYDSTQRVPLLMSGPGLPRGRVVSELVRLVDVAPTLLELVGAAPLQGPGGRSLLPLIEGEMSPPRAAYLETLATQFDMRWSPLFGLRTGRYKYIRAPRPELYDLVADPGELENLHESRSDLVNELSGILDSELGEGGPIRPNLALGDGDRALLESLGYVDPVGPLESSQLGRVGGVDPKDEIQSITVIHRVNTLIAADRADEALELLEPLGDRGYNVQVFRAMAALHAGRHELARQAAELAVETGSGRGADTVLLGLALERLGRFEEAEAAYQRSLAIDSARAAPLVGLGRIAERRAERDEARAYYARAVEARVPNAEANWRLGALLLEDGEIQRAVALVSRVPAKQLRDVVAAHRLASAELEAGRYEMGLLRVNAGLRADPDAAELLILKGVLLERIGRLAEALVVRERAFALDPESPAARNDLAWSLALLGRDLDRALELARAAVSASDADPQAMDTLASVLLRRGEAREALEVIVRALEQSEAEGRGMLLVHRAEALVILGDASAARAALVEARESAGGESDALEPHLRRIRGRLGRLEAQSR